MPLSKDVGKNMTELTDKHPDWPYKRRLVASLNAAREHGARIRAKKTPAKRKKVVKRGKRK